tara:strand:+ start:296 stop:493 length:198 start_codon:yes stop_codon:yes gene_type:complete
MQVVAVELVTLVALEVLEVLEEVVMLLEAQAMAQLELLTLEEVVELEVTMVQQMRTEMVVQVDQE